MTPTLSEYVMKETDTTSDLSEVMKRKKTAKALELENLQYDAQIAEEKRKIQEASPTKPDASQVTTLFTMIFAGKSPAEIKEIIDSLTQEQIDKVRYMSESMTPNNLRGLIQPQNTSIKEIIEIVKLVSELQQPKNQGTNDMKGMAELVKAIAEINKAQNPPPSPQPQQDPVQVYKVVQEMMQPYRETIDSQTKQLNELRIKEVESRIIDPTAYIKNIKSQAADLGFTQPGATNEMTLRQAEMAQTERLENRKLDFEMKKYDLEASKGDATAELIKEGIKAVTSGPVGELIGNLGKAGADRIRGSTASNSNASQAPVQIGTAVCPNCQGSFRANLELPMVQCPLCGIQLSRGNQPAPVTQSQDVLKDQPPSDSAQAQPSPSAVQDKPVDQTVEVEPIAEQPAKQ